MDKARQLRDVWQARVSKAGNALDLDVVNGLNNMTLDVIGLAGAYCDDRPNGRLLHAAALSGKVEWRTCNVELATMFSPVQLLHDMLSMLTVSRANRLQLRLALVELGEQAE